MCNLLFIIGFFILFILYYSYTKSKSENLTFIDDKLILYYAHWCHHCKTFLPEWKKIVDMNIVKTDKIECTNNKEVCSKQNIIGYPTIVYMKNNKPHIYPQTMNRTSNDILKYFKLI